MKFLLWESDKAFAKGKQPTDEIVLNYRTQVQPLGKKMGKAFCIHILTNGANEALWAHDVDDQNAWIDAITRACKKPEEPKPAPILIAGNSGNTSASDIKIQVAMPAAQPAVDPNLAYQQALMQQQYQQQLAAYNQMLMQQQQQQQFQQPMMVNQQQQQQQQYHSSGSLPMMPPPPMYGAAAAAPPPQIFAPSFQVAPDYYSHASPAASPAPSPVMARHSPPPQQPQTPQISSVPTTTKDSPYGRF
jgi:hypothetical protein